MYKIYYKLENHWNWLDVYYDRCLYSVRNNDQRTSLATTRRRTNFYHQCDYCEDVNQINQLNGSWFNNDKERILDRITFLIANRMPFIYYDLNLTDEIRAWPLGKHFHTIKQFTMVLFFYYHLDMNFFVLSIKFSFVIF